MLTLSRIELGAAGPLHVRRERVAFGLRLPVKLLYVSDLHLGWPWSNGLVEYVPNVARSVNPDAIVLGGDLADRGSALGLLQDCVVALARIAPVCAIAGNHDNRLGIAKVMTAVRQGGGTWLTTPVFLCTDLCLCSRARIATQMGVHRVLCAHNPAVFPEACRAGVDLVLAGHLHGGQCVVATLRDRLYPGAWFSRWTGLRFAEGSSTMLVSRGAADTLPVRWNCPREVIVCDIF